MSVQTPIKVKPATKQEFITALRSGEYEQNTNGNMKADNKVCAMMVYHLISGDPETDAEIAGNSILGIPVKIYNQITELNDTPYNFRAIATILEKHLSDDMQSFTYAN